MNDLETDRDISNAHILGIAAGDQRSRGHIRISNRWRRRGRFQGDWNVVSARRRRISSRRRYRCRCRDIGFLRTDCSSVCSRCETERQLVCEVDSVVHFGLLTRDVVIVERN